MRMREAADPITPDLCCLSVCLLLQGDEQSWPMSAKGQSQQQSDMMMMMMRSQGNVNNNVNGQPPSAAAAAAVATVKEPSRHDETRPGRDGMSPVSAQWTALHPSAVAAVSRGFSDPSLAVVQPASNSHNNNKSNGSVVVGCGGPKSPELFHSHHYHARRQRDRQQQSVNSNCNSRSSSAADLSLLQSSTVNLSSFGNQHGSASSSLNNVNHIKVSLDFIQLQLLAPISNLCRIFVREIKVASFPFGFLFQFRRKLELF